VGSLVVMIHGFPESVVMLRKTMVVLAIALALGGSGLSRT
jgi:hypothetical protein